MAWICILSEVGERPLLPLLPLLLLPPIAAQATLCCCCRRCCCCSTCHSMLGAAEVVALGGLQLMLGAAAGAIHVAGERGCRPLVHAAALTLCSCAHMCFPPLLSFSGFSALMIIAKYYLDNWGPNS